MKLSAATIMTIAAVLGVVSGGLHDWQEYRISVSTAIANHTKPPDWDGLSFAIRITKALMLALGVGAGVTQFPGVS